MLGSPIPSVVCLFLWLNMTNQFLFVVNSTGGSLSVIDTSTDKEVQRFSGLSDPTQVVWDNTLQRVYVVNSGSNTINIYNGAARSLALLRTVPLSASPLGIAAPTARRTLTRRLTALREALGFLTRKASSRRQLCRFSRRVLIAAHLRGSSKVYVVNMTGRRSDRITYGYAKIPQAR